MLLCSYTPVTAGHSTSKAKGSQGMHELKIKCFVSKGMHGPFDACHMRNTE